MLISLVLLFVGLGILVAGGEYFVRGASSIATHFSIPPIVIGLTIVAFGTSMPELVVNLIAVSEGSSGLAIGNILGSNIANILLILGICALVYPLSVNESTVWKEIPFLVLVNIVLLIMSFDTKLAGQVSNMLSRADGLILVAFFILFLYYVYGLAKNGSNEQRIKSYSMPVSVSFIFLGGIALFFGGKLMVEHAIILARLAGLSELFIGLTIAAVGTSLPELVTSIIATYHKQTDLAIGNVIGSNIFNILWILGITSILAPLAITNSIHIDMLVATGAAALLFPFMFLGGKKGRNKLRSTEGILFLLLYAGYIGFIMMRG